MRHVKHIELRKGMTVADMAEQMKACGVLGAGRIGEAAHLVAEMFHDPDYTVFLTLAGALVPGGMRKIVADLIKNGHVHVIVTTGSNIVHDLVEALGHKHVVGTFKSEDKRLKREKIGRIGDIYIPQKAFQDMEKWLYKTLEQIPEERRKRLAPSDLLREIGKHVEDPDSILANAYKKNVPIICPGLADSIAGFQLWVFKQDKPLTIDPLLDTQIIVDKVYDSKKTGIIILGGGWPKHFALFANTFRDGVDCAVQITMDRPEPGGLSGASLEEAVSWSKINPEGRTVDVVCDVTIAFPLIIAAALDKA